MNEMTSLDGSFSFRLTETPRNSISPWRAKTDHVLDIRGQAQHETLASYETLWRIVEAMRHSFASRAERLARPIWRGRPPRRSSVRHRASLYQTGWDD